MNETWDVSRGGEGENIQEAYDYFNGASAFIIADTAADGAWIAVPEGQETSVEACR